MWFPHIVTVLWLVSQTLRMSRWGDRLKKVEQLAQSFQHQPQATRYKPRLWLCQPSSTWKLFPRQSLAFSFARSCKEVETNPPSTILCVSPPLIFSGQLININLFFVSRLFMFLRSKKKVPVQVRESTWSPVTVSCGITTGMGDRQKPRGNVWSFC